MSQPQQQQPCSEASAITLLLADHEAFGFSERYVLICSNVHDIIISFIFTVYHTLFLSPVVPCTTLIPINHQ